VNYNSSISYQSIFSQKAHFYKHARPCYPAPIFKYLANLLKPGSRIVEFGCGTGIFTKELLKYDYEVYAVEPCKEMLAECKTELIHHNNVIFIESRAEETILKKESIDAFVFPQSLHWMDIEKIKEIITHAGNYNSHIFTVWNSRNNSDTNCAIKYNQIINNYKKRHPLSIQVQTDS
jgi:SAM-dependent methyltransferase